MSQHDVSIRLAISTCPNDTFAFAALMNRQVDWRGINFQLELLDIEQLNQRVLSGDFDIAKASFHAALLAARQCVVLPSGSALGFGVGPLLLAARPHERPHDASQRVLCPGQHTTATLLFRLFYPDTATMKQVVFSEIMPSLRRGEADFGVCIHEGRFTWQQQQLALVEDLGSRWEQTTGYPLPLGGILARRSLPAEVIARVQAVVADSLAAAQRDPQLPLETMRYYAQEFDDQVLMRHVELYVNQWTENLGDQGAAALAALAEKAREVGLIDRQATLQLFG